MKEAHFEKREIILRNVLITISELKQAKKENQRQYRCLLLGCGEAGKSTFIKQMRIIHGDEFTDDEKEEFKVAIAKNILSAMKSLLENMSFEEEHAIQSDDALDNAMQNVLYKGYGIIGVLFENMS